ncbi:MAG: dicarboxylate/amino acid:cation symporter [Gammaproteobacteria bacterium]|nr:dicarboxylate/amino acid:cation symporter [Gammaproteobacteria bacterium]
MAMLHIKLHWQILIALLLAVLVGSAVGETATLFGVAIVDILDFLGALFMNALKMLIVPLIVSAIISGIAGVGHTGAFGRLGLKTLLYYATTTLAAILVGLTLVNLIQPGLVGGTPVREQIGLTADGDQIAADLSAHGAGDLVAVFMRLIPPNVVAAAAEGQMLGLIFFSLLFGYFMTRIGEPYAGNLLGFWQGTFEVMMRITGWVMRFAPLGVFALVGKVVATTGMAAFQPLLIFFLTVLAGLAFHFLVVLPAILLLVARVNPLRHYQAMAPALLMAFSTASSSATLPITLSCVERQAGVSNRTSSFVLPLGATVNMDGTALYECVAAMFIAQAYGVELGFAQQLLIVTLALLTSIGVAGIPAASLVAITVILTAVGLPVEAVGMILAVDRVLDMCRTAVNVFSDSCGAVVVARLEGEEGILQAPS